MNLQIVNYLYKLLLDMKGLQLCLDLAAGFENSAIEPTGHCLPRLRPIVADIIYLQTLWHKFKITRVLC